MKQRTPLAAATLILLIAFALLPSGAFAAMVDAQPSPAGESQGERQPRFIDEVGLITPEQAASLTARLDEISERQQFDVVVAVVSALDDREARLYAIDFFEENGFGYGEELDGAILLLAVEERDFGFAGYGFALEAFTDAGQEYLDTLFVPYLQEDNYYEAFMAFAGAADDFVTKAKAGEPYDSDNIPLSSEDILILRLASAGVILFLVYCFAFYIIGKWKRQLVSVRKDSMARAYIREGSAVLTVQRDDFLYSHVDKTARAGDSDDDNSFSSSSGRDSTGHSGKY